MRLTESFSVSRVDGLLTLFAATDAVGRPEYVLAMTDRANRKRDVHVEFTDEELRLLIQAAAAVIR